jgi:sugar-specific transcriptional regulator TrmB
LVGVEVLVGLGLSGRQARVYLATLKLGGGKVQAIAELSKVSRQEIYRLIVGMQELGIMQKNLTNPTTYTATPIGQASRLLLQQKTIELSSLTQQTKQLTRKLSQNGPVVPVSVDLRPCFGAIFESDRGKKYQQILTSTEHSIDAVLSWWRFRQLNIHFEAQLQSALKRGVSLKIVTEKPPNHHLPKWIKPAMKQYPNFALRIQQKPVAVAVTVFDESIADIAFNPNSSLTKGPDLWTATQSITALCNEYFNAVWNQTSNNNY